MAQVETWLLIIAQLLESIQGPFNALVTEEEFCCALVSNDFPMPSTEQYEEAVQRAGPDGSITTKREFAMFITQIMWESGGLQFKEEIACRVTNCPDNYRTPKDVPGQYYFGRGYIQLTWHFNYLAASLDLFGDDRLARNPQQVADDEGVSWATAFWFWKVNVHPEPGVADGEFGATTNAINGELECRGKYQEKARKRFGMYKKVLLALSINETANEKGCYPLNSTSDNPLLFM